MELPTQLPKELLYCQTSTDDLALFNLLRQKEHDLVLFTIGAIQDDLWITQHRSFIGKALELITRHYFQGKSDLKTAKELAHHIREHASSIENSLPLDIKVEFAGKRYTINSILFTCNSSYFQNMIFNESAERNTKLFRFRDSAIYIPFFEIYMMYCQKGDIPDLWRHPESELLQLMDCAIYCGAEELETLIASCYHSYLNQENVFGTLLESYKKQRRSLAKICTEYINNLSDTGIRFIEGRNDCAIFIEDYTDIALRALERLKDEVHFLGCHRRICSSSRWLPLLEGLHHLEGLDLSDTDWTEQMEQLPQGLEEIHLSRCPWLDPKRLELILKRCPHVIRLFLCEQTHLPPKTWQLLSTLPNLSTLDLSGCSQVKDTDLKMIALSCGQLRSLALKECFLITDRAFFELTRYCKQLEDFDAERTLISDQGLVEIAFRCPLRSLRITLCENLTEHGIIEAIRHTPNLTFLDIRSCRINSEGVASIQRLRPQLTIETGALD